MAKNKRRINSEKKLEDLIGSEKQNGISLTCLGVGMGNYKDSKIEILSKKGDGNFAYIDSIQEAEKVLVTEFTQTLYSVAKNVQLTIQFDSNQVSQYRLIGFDNKRASLEDKSNQLEGGEIGSGSGNTIIFEIVPSKSNNFLSTIAMLSVRYHLPKDTSQQIMQYNCVSNYLEFKGLNKSLQLATAVTMFGLKLRGSKYFPPTKWDIIKNIASSAINPDNYLENQFMELIEKSENFYEKKKKKSWWR
jgi:Ca-activated chloride channel family protein